MKFSLLPEIRQNVMRREKEHLSASVCFLSIERSFLVILIDRIYLIPKTSLGFVILHRLNANSLQVERNTESKLKMLLNASI